MSCSLGQDKLFDLTFDLREVYENDGHIPLTCHSWSSPDESILLDALKDPTGSRSSSTKSLQSFSWVGDLGFHFFEENHSFVLCHYHHVIKPLAIFFNKTAHDIWHKKVHQIQKFAIFPIFKCSTKSSTLDDEVKQFQNITQSKMSRMYVDLVLRSSSEIHEMPVK